MNIFLLLLLAYFVLQGLYSGYHLLKGKQLNKVVFNQKINAGDKNKPFLKVFMIGDSVGAGVGATSFETSLAGRLVDYLSKDHYVNFENISVTGNKMGDILAGAVPEVRQDLIVLVVGSNNLFHFTNLERFRRETREVFARLAPLGERVVIIGPGNIANSRAVPLILKPFYKLQAPKYSNIIKEEASQYKNIKHVNPIDPPDGLPQYGHTFASDNFHPNDEGHRFWFDMLKTAF